jgi:hypothetical protein
MGFFLLHTGFANNEFFPNDKAVLRRRGEPGLAYDFRHVQLTYFVGQDAIIGGAKPIVRGTAPIQSPCREINATLTNDDGTRYQITGFAEEFDSSEPLPWTSSPLQVERAYPEKLVVKGTAAIKDNGPVVLKLRNGNKVYELFGFAKEVVPQSASVGTQDFFVTPRGGEYFFIPSISTVKAWATAAWAHHCVNLF